MDSKIADLRLPHVFRVVIDSRMHFDAKTFINIAGFFQRQKHFDGIHYYGIINTVNEIHAIGHLRVKSIVTKIDLPLFILSCLVEF